MFRTFPINFILLAVFTIAESIMLGMVSFKIIKNILSNNYFIPQVSTLYDTESVIIAAGVTALIVFFLTIFAFQVINPELYSNALLTLNIFQTKIDFTMCRGVMGCILFVFIICGLIMLFVPYDRYRGEYSL